MGNLIEITNMLIALGTMATLTILILSIQEHGYLSISLNHFQFLYQCLIVLSV